MSDTKERILSEALKLFSVNGYASTSVRQIASMVGISQAALYKHYENKEDILQNIVSQMELNDKKRAELYDVPVQAFEINPQEYSRTSKNNLISFTLAQFSYWTEDEFACNFRKMITLEQYKSKQMSEYFYNYLGDGVVKYVSDIFSEMIENGLLEEKDSYVLALSYYAPFFMMMNFTDHGASENKANENLKNHIKSFFEKYERKIEK